MCSYPALASSVIIIAFLASNEYGLLSSLKQEGWTIRYLSYSKWGDYGLPDRIKITREPIDMTIIVNRWRLK